MSNNPKANSLWQAQKVDPFIDKYLLRKQQIHNCDKYDKTICSASRKYYKQIRDNYEKNNLEVKAKYQLYLDRDLLRFEADSFYREAVLKYLLDYIKLFKYFIDNYFELRLEYKNGSDRVWNRKTRYRRDGIDLNTPRVRKLTKTKGTGKLNVALTDQQKQDLEISKLTKKYVQETKNKKLEEQIRTRNL